MKLRGLRFFILEKTLGLPLSSLLVPKRGPARKTDRLLAKTFSDRIRENSFKLRV